MATDLAKQHAADQVYAHLRGAIERNILKPNQRILSTRELERGLNASHYAVIKAMDRLVREGWVTRRVGAGTYVRGNGRGTSHLHARHRIGLLTNSIHPVSFPFLRPVIDAARAEFARCGISVRSQEVSKPISPALLELLDEEETVVWVQDNLPPDLRLPQRPRAILVGQDCEHFEPKEVVPDIVTVDSRQGGAAAARHLREIGCSRAIFVGVWCAASGDWEPLSRARLEGFQTGWGRPVPPENLMRMKDYSMVGAIARVDGLLARLSADTGVFAASDDLAMGICHGAIAHGRVMGRDIRIVGFDGQPCRYPGEPVLTTVAAPLAEMGRQAARLALERAECPGMPSRRILLGCSIRKGGST